MVLSRRATLIAAASPWAAQSPAQTAWPSRAVHALLSFPPGGAIDTVSHLIARRMGGLPGQALVVENRGGAMGSLAAGMMVASPAFPDLPTPQQAGLGGYDWSEWSGVFAPAGTLPAVFAWLRAALRETLFQPAVTKRQGVIGMAPLASTRAEFAGFVAAQKDLTGRLTRTARITAE